MVNLQDIWRQIEKLDPQQQEELFGYYLSRYFPPRVFWWFGIDKTDGVCGGSARIVRTRIPVWVLQQMRNLKMTEAEILNNYPTLRAEDLVSAWRYVDSHSAEIEEEIRENEAA